MGENPDKYDYVKAQVRVCSLIFFHMFAIKHKRKIYICLPFPFFYTCVTQGPGATNGRD